MKNHQLNQSDFLSLFQNTRFRYIHDVEKTVRQGNSVLELRWNKQGYGTFFTVNGFPPDGPADESRLLSLNGNYVDYDVDLALPEEEKDRLIQETLMLALEKGALSPTLMTRTRKGVHLIWLYPQPIPPTSENLTKWKGVQKRLVHCFKGDTNAVDPSRVLRVPYTLHLKDPNQPFEIKVTSYKAENRYSLEEIDKDTPHYSEQEINKKKLSVNDVLFNGVEVGKGLRHMGLAQIAGIALKGAKTSQQVEIARLALYAWDQFVVESPEPLKKRKKELDNTINGILSRELKGKTISSDSAEKSKPQLWTVGDILKHDFGEQQWIVDSLISKQGIAALSGNPGDYKTWVTIHIALCVSRNLPVFGKFETTQGAVLMIDEEDHLRVLKERLKSLGVNEKDGIHYFSQSGIQVDDESAREMIIEIIKDKNIKLVILDSLVRVHSQKENDAGEMATVFRGLQEIIKAGASVLFTHHHRKQLGFGSNNNPGQSMRGSSDILAAVDSHVTIEKDRDEDDRLIIRQTKLRQAEALKPFQISILKGENGPSGFGYVGLHDEKKKKAAEVAEAIVYLQRYTKLSKRNMEKRRLISA